MDFTHAEIIGAAPRGFAPVETNPARVYLAGLGAQTRQNVAIKLARFAALMGFEDVRHVDWSQMRYEHVVALKTHLLEQGLSASTVNSYVSALRGVALEAWNLKVMSAEDLKRIQEVKNVRSVRLLRGRALTREEVAALFADCLADPLPHGARDAAILAVLVGGGLRRSEGGDLLVGDYDGESASLRVRHGKGDKERVVYLTGGAGAAVDAWLGVRGSDPGPLFCRVNCTGRIVSVKLSTSAVYLALRKRAARAGVRPFSPHDLRRTFISDLLDAGADLATVQRQAGYASPAMTERYDRRGGHAKRRAASPVSIPCPASP
jgi:integrase